MANLVLVCVILLLSPVLIYSYDAEDLLNNKVVRIYKTPRTWYYGFALCNQMGMHLPRVEDEDQQILLLNLTQKHGLSKTWLGGTNLGYDQHWYWIDSGAEIIFENWQIPPTKTKRCIYMKNANQRNWNDDNCDKTYSVICV